MHNFQASCSYKNTMTQEFVVTIVTWRPVRFLAVLYRVCLLLRLPDLETILKRDVPRQKRFWSTDIIKVPAFVLRLWLRVQQRAATEGFAYPIPFLFTFVSIIFLLQLARQHRGHCNCCSSKKLSLFSRVLILPENCWSKRGTWGILRQTTNNTRLEKMDLMTCEILNITEKWSHISSYGLNSTYLRGYCLARFH